MALTITECMHHRRSAPRPQEDTFGMGPMSGPTSGNRPRREPAPGFGETLRAYRERHGMSQARLGEQARYDISAVSRLESGDREPTRKGLVRLCAALELDGIDRARLYLSAGYVPPDLLPVFWLALDAMEEGTTDE